MHLNGKITNPGQMRTAILLEPRLVTQDPGGAQRKAWDSTRAVRRWSKWTNAHGEEVWAADAAHADQPGTVTIRYLADLDSTWSVLKNGVRYEIVGSVDDIQERHEYQEFKVKRWRSGSG